ncbi:hypothetical protein N7509_012400 [Penicillium cosmopolitanum]|uniref:SGTA homodimerisation domain-containing protein n=1 Tax=Penicillium cosmopolitanum TaxID=1131564 RepID=A0A9W9SIK9_9EURO|nr:uncharacterized protein N7509_012400 [Penicillium cosmopolitanum]KAJ5379281.1 hypothetical protein N7509_012400 [Penicillium cosmopolitanum]
MAPTESNKRLALAIIDFLGSSLKDGTLTADDAESIEIAQSCIADTFKVDPSNEAAVKEAVGGQSLANIYSVYEKLRNKSTPQPDAGAAQQSQEQKPTKAGTPTDESDKLKSEGNSLMSKKDYPAAIEKYTQALEIAPANPIYLSNRAAAYSASRNHEKAAEDALLATTVDPKYSKAWSRLGLARFDMGDYHAAKEAYESGIAAEGNGGSDAMKRASPPSEELDTASGASRGGTGGMPDLASLAGMFGGGGAGGGGGMPDLSSMMSNPMFSQMAQNLMGNPDMLNNLMSNPRLREMAENFGQGGGMPDMSSIMSDPNLADMARNMMGGGGAGGAGRDAGNQQ